MFQPTTKHTNPDGTTVEIFTSIIIGKGVHIDPNAKIGECAVIGDNTSIGAFTVIGAYTSIGIDVRIGERVTIGKHAQIGDGVRMLKRSIFVEDCGIVTEHLIMSYNSVVKSFHPVLSCK